MTAGEQACLWLIGGMWFFIEWILWCTDNRPPIITTIMSLARKVKQLVETVKIACSDPKDPPGNKLYLWVGKDKKWTGGNTGPWYGHQVTTDLETGKKSLEPGAALFEYVLVKKYICESKISEHDCGCK